MARQLYRVLNLTDKAKTLRRLKGICYHEIVEVGDYGGAKCKYCGPYEMFGEKGRPFGWYCPDSPDHQCHYYSEVDNDGQRFVTSINDEKIILIGYKNVQWETDDCCIFCGMPEERK